MGSLGAGRLSPGSDLDLIVIYDPRDETESKGAKPLATRLYYARLTQALVTALSAQTAEGRLYEVDMRLRPSGNQGPVATSWAAFQSYQRTEAWIWEHLALTRAQVIAGPQDLAQDITAFLSEVLSLPRAREDVLQAVRDMRARIAEAKGRGNLWFSKSGPGQPQDIELFAQASALMRGALAHDIPDTLAALPDTGLSDSEGAAQLQTSYLHGKSVQMASQLIAGGASSTEGLGQAALGFLARALEADTMELAEARLTESTARAASVIDTALEPSHGKG
jgi:glutamate-ammonia-ligase adenylyltransferase